MYIYIASRHLSLGEIIWWASLESSEVWMSMLWEYWLWLYVNIHHPTTHLQHYSSTTSPINKMNAAVNNHAGNIIIITVYLFFLIYFFLIYFFFGKSSWLHKSRILRLVYPSSSQPCCVTIKSTQHGTEQSNNVYLWSVFLSDGSLCVKMHTTIF